MLITSNPKFIETYGESVEIAPDADAVLTQEVIDKFKMPRCSNPKCGSDRLKPDVVFFGDNVKRDIVDFCYNKVEESDVLLVLGSTLEVYSSYRFARHAAENNVEIINIGIGPTRADKFQQLKLECDLVEFCRKFE